MSNRNLLLFLALPMIAAAEPAPGYQQPPDAIRSVLDAPPSPVVSLSPAGDWLVLGDWQRYPPIADLARPVLRLAGLRLDPATNGPQRRSSVTRWRMRALDGTKKFTLELPKTGSPSAPIWSPDGKRFAILLTGDTDITLWLGVVGESRPTRVANLRINAAYGDPVTWMPDSNTLICQAIPAERGKAPERPRQPAGPVIQESSGKAAPVRTYQDMLKDKHDEALFDYYATSQLVLVSAADGKITPVGKPDLFADIQPSPDGKYLLVTRTRKPYSYVLPAGAFPKTVEVIDTAGKSVYRVAELPLADSVPIEGVPTGPRAVLWWPTRPATLGWVSALDEGDPRKKVDHRDTAQMITAPFTDKPTELAKTENRFIGLAWGERETGLLSDYNRETRRRRTYLIKTDDPKAAPRLIWDRSVQDRYGDPGAPLTRQLPNGQAILRMEGDSLFLAGAGASPKGERPFLDRFDLKTGKATRLFQSAADAHESVLGFIGDRSGRFITRHESPTSPPNYRLRQAGKDEPVELTDFKDTSPELRKIQRRLVRYTRADGVPLSFTLYLPPDYKEGTRLPTVVWAYPREFTDSSVAGQVVGSPNRFTTLVGTSHLFFLLNGYAVLDDATMPVVGAPEKANNTFVEQITSSAKAAIDKAVELGVTDPHRVGVGGHSYGAFMTANLLAHSDLFRAGIARSGAYNRTLTPFGFQNERRTLWQAPEVYAKMSPFMHADKINEPILLIHGDSDNNPGTFPLQSERLYQAIRGNGGTVRYVSLPFESHGYQAKESVGHTLWEMMEWFDRHVKAAKPKRKEPAVRKE